MPVIRIEVRAMQAGDDPTGAGVLSEIRQLGIAEVAEVRAARVFLLQGGEGVLTPGNLERIAREVLIDPVTETFAVSGQSSVASGQAEGKIIEVHLKPGVMDPVAASCEMAIADLLAEGSVVSGQSSVESKTAGAGQRVEVLTGKKYELLGEGGVAVSDGALRVIAKRLLVNESIETGHFAPFTPAEFPRGHAYQFVLTHVAIRELTDEQLLELSRKGHLFLDLREMQAIQAYFRQQQREPTDVELETLAQTWSEHCGHKTLKATVEFTEIDRRATPREDPLGTI